MLMWVENVYQVEGRIDGRELPQLFYLLSKDEGLRWDNVLPDEEETTPPASPYEVLLRTSLINASDE